MSKDSQPNQNELLQEFAQRIFGLKEEDILFTTLAFVSEMLGLNESSIAKYYPERKTFELYQSNHDDQKLPKGKICQETDVILSKMVQDKKEIIRPDLAKESELFPVDHLLIEAGIQSDYLVPLVINNVFYGSLNIFSKETNGIDEQSRNTINMLVPFVGFALNNTVLNRELAAEKSRYQELVEHAKSMILWLDKNAIILYANEFAVEFFGFDHTELIGQSVLSTLVPEHDSEGRDLRKLVERAFEKPEDFGNSENENICKNGELKWISWTNNLIKDEAGDFKYLLSIGNDITARKETERSLQRKLEIEHIINDISKQLISSEETTIDEAIVTALQTIGEFAGAVRSTLFLLEGNGQRMTNTHDWFFDSADSQKDWFQEVPFSEFDFYKKSLNNHEVLSIQQLSDLPEEAKDELEWVTKYGFRSLFFVPIIVKGQLRGACGLYGKVNEVVNWPNDLQLLLETTGNLFVPAIEKKETSNKLRTTMREIELLASIVKSSQDLIGIADIDGKVTYLNEAGKQMVSISEQVYNKGTNMLDYLPPYEQRRMADVIIPEVLKNGRWVGDLDLVDHSNGQTIPTHCDLFRVDDPKSGTPFKMATVTRDIRKEVEKQNLLKQKERDLQEAQSIAKIGSWSLT